MDNDLQGAIQQILVGESQEVKPGHSLKAEDIEPSLILSGKYVIVTGGYAGIGYETVRAFAKKDAHVFVIGRDVARGKKAVEELKKDTLNDKIEYEEVDLGSFESIRDFAHRFNAKNIPLHYLINNAGVMATPFGRTKDGLETQIGINHFGHFLLTHLLLPRLLSGAPSRVINVSSAGHAISGLKDDYNWEKDSYVPFQAHLLINFVCRYAQSKTANILFSNELTRRYKNQGIISNSVHPGVIFTGLGKHISIFIGNFKKPEEMIKAAQSEPKIVETLKYSRVPKTPQQGAATTLFAALSPSASSGGFYDDCEEAIPAAHASDAEAAKRLWEISEKIIGV